ncbi:4-coumarate--CoA ligase-like 10 [Platanthera guangdongensis]|uniref:4-coumarate--CoA ligase-like 10 n=1 Tax=Platanthera guangdongensis TaxID=2320717 RepID=A0ABR2LSK3_9ASPA
MSQVQDINQAAENGITARGVVEVPPSFGTLKCVAADFSSRRALFVAGKLEITYSLLDDLVDFTTSLLLEVGILHGDVVALTFSNSVEVRIILP